MKEILSIIILPLAAGILLFCIPDRFRLLKGVAAAVIVLAACYFSGTIYYSHNQQFSLKDIALISGLSLSVNNVYAVFNCDNLSKLILLIISILSFLIILYSIVYIRTKKCRNYFSYYLITAGCAFGAVLSDNLLLFLSFWGVLGLTLYKLIESHDEESSAAAKKTLILVGASDSIMIIGIAIIWSTSGYLNIKATPLPTTSFLSVLAFMALLCGSFTKAGAFPFHTWVPDYSKNAPAVSSAFLPASLDKLLGIYFLARITGDIFVMSQWLKFLLLTAGVTSIITAVMMALTQHNYKRLLGFHAVSQVGYMILGFGLGSAIGVAAGLFHMLNNAIYKTGLFLSAGSVEYRTGIDDIDGLGGLSKKMPVTFVATLIFAMSISGVPPLNGFASKWMIYQGIIESGNGPGIANQLWVLWLGLAVLGSALTLASFIKLVGGIFLGRRKQDLENVREVPFLMWMPQALLAIICVLTGIFATGFVVRGIIIPVSGEFTFAGFWNSTLVSILVLISLILGALIYLSAGLRRFRTEDSFIGGEKMQEETGFATTEFYKSITEFSFFSRIYKKAGEKWFDIYDLSKKSVLWLSHGLSEAHSGVLTGYLIWVCAGLIIMLMIMI